VNIVKKIAVVTGAIIGANTVANIGIIGAQRLLATTGGTVSGLAFIAAPLLIPAPLTYKHMISQADEA